MVLLVGSSKSGVLFDRAAQAFTPDLPQASSDDGIRRRFRNLDLGV